MGNFMGRPVQDDHPDSNNNNNKITTAEEWFSSGQRVLYDPVAKKIIGKKDKKTPEAISVFERVVTSSLENNLDQNTTRWITMAPGFPDGSYGYSHVDRLLSDKATAAPRLYIEYVGMGNSDKPASYKYSTMERADLIEAQWEAHGIKRTVMVTFDIGSLVLLELLQRQKERCARGILYPKIEHVLAMNGGLFPDGHSHPWDTTPLLKTWVGKILTWMAQRSDTLFDYMLKPLYSQGFRDKYPNRLQSELRQIEKAIRLHNGAAFLHNAAGLVDEHQKEYPKRWDLADVYNSFCQDEGITLHLVGSAEDQFEHNQIRLARERLGHHHPNNVKIETIPGGHFSTSEQVEKLAELITSLSEKK